MKIMRKLTAGKFSHKLMLSFLFALALIGLMPSAAHAIPAYARQTGQECAACHVGSFGPQLTTYGRNFKLNGYIWGDVKHLWDGFSGMVVAGFEHTKKAQDAAPAVGYGTNNAWSMDQASLFYGGRILPNLGVMSQVTYNAPAQTFSWDNTDIRFADNTTIAGTGLLYGISVNNNPTMQDVWQTTPAWAFPYTKSGLAPSPAVTPYISTLGQRVVGAGAYGLWDDLVYAELSGYTNLSNETQSTLGLANASTIDHLDGIAPYYRVALQHDFGPHYVSVGAFGLDANRFPGNVRDFGTDNIFDYAFDATYQFASADNKHNVSLYGSYLKEIQNLDATFASAASSNAKNDLTSIHMNGSYYYENTYGFTLGRFMTTGSSDAILYANPSNNRPNSAGWTVQFDWTPFGNDNSYGASYMNARFFLQYTLYNAFDGTPQNYDGAGRDATDNDTLFVGTWLAF